MSKIIKIYLSQGFTPVDNRIFQLGTIVDFNCYIQRFNGFVILIEKGTFIDEKIYALLTRKNLQIFVQTKKYKDYKNYIEKNEVEIPSAASDEEICKLTEAMEKCSSIRTLLKKHTSVTDKLKIIYTYAKYLLNAWINEKDELRIPIDSLTVLVDELVSVANEEHLTLSKFNDFLDVEDSLAAHQVKVAFFAAIIGSQIGLDHTDQQKLFLSAMLHDIGKTDWGDALLHKPDMLTHAEYKTIQRHSDVSVYLARQSGLKDRLVLNAIKEHHERLDGSGYPKGLKAEQISNFAKILAVCDMFDALITVKPYRGAYSTFNALRVIREDAINRGKLEVGYVNLLIKYLK